MTDYQIENITKGIAYLIWSQAVGVHFSVRLDEQWHFSFQTGSNQSEFCLTFSWYKDGRRHSKSEREFVDNEKAINWRFIKLWLTQNRDKLEQR